MSYFSKLFAEIWRDFANDGVPASGANPPVKADIRDWGELVEAQVQLVSVIDADRSGNDVNTAQAVFESGEDALTLEADTTYEFAAQYWITRAAGTTSHTTSVLFGGDAVLTSIGYLAQVTNPTGNVLESVQQVMGAAAAALVLTAANTSATENLLIRLNGIIRVGTAGTLIPQFQYSAAPGGAPTVKAGSYFKVRKLGAGDVVAIGPWA
jgi:hypothetical protein